MSCSMYPLFNVSPSISFPSLTTEGSDLVGFHKLSNFQPFNDLDGEDRQTSWSSSRSFCPPGCGHCKVIRGWFLYGDSFSEPEQPRARLDTSSE